MLSDEEIFKDVSELVQENLERLEASEHVLEDIVSDIESSEQLASSVSFNKLEKSLLSGNFSLLKSRSARKF